MMQSNSVEEQKYRSALKAEKEAFQALIFDKGRMALPADWDGRTETVGGAADSSTTDGTFGGNAATRWGRLLTSYYLPPTAYYSLLSAYCSQLATYYLRSTHNYCLLAAYY